jgi:hypothetical protein
VATVLFWLCGGGVCGGLWRLKFVAVGTTAFNFNAFSYNLSCPKINPRENPFRFWFMFSSHFTSITRGCWIFYSSYAAFYRRTILVPVSGVWGIRSCENPAWQRSNSCRSVSPLARSEYLSIDSPSICSVMHVSGLFWPSSASFYGFSLVALVLEYGGQDGPELLQEPRPEDHLCCSYCHGRATEYASDIRTGCWPATHQVSFV